MNTELKKQFDELAQQAVGQRVLQHPAFAGQSAVASPDRGPFAFALAALAIVIVLAGGIWWAQRDTPQVLDTISPVGSLPIPQLLLEEPTPLAEVPEQLRDIFIINPELRSPLHQIDPTGPPLVFDGIHLVEHDRILVGIGLDTTGQVLCTGNMILDDEVATGGCSTLASFAGAGIVTQVTSGPIRNSTTSFVDDELAAGLFTSSVALAVQRNVAFFDRFTISSGERLDNSTRPINDFRETPGPASGELSIDETSFSVISGVGCSLNDDAFLVEAAFTALDEGFVMLPLVTPQGLVLEGLGETSVSIVATDAQIETTRLNGEFSVHATWSTPESTGSLRIDCGERLIDISSIR